jgi:hypothetical protein
MHMHDDVDLGLRSGVGIMHRALLFERTTCRVLRTAELCTLDQQGTCLTRTRTEPQDVVGGDKIATAAERDSPGVRGGFQSSLVTGPCCPVIAMLVPSTTKSYTP